MNYKITPFLKTSFLDPNKPDIFIEEVVNKYASEKNKWLGFNSKRALKDFLFRQVFSGKYSTELPTFSEKKIKTLIEDTLTEISNFLIKQGNLEFFLFPTLSIFIIDNMNGVSGFTPSNEIIHLYLHQSDGRDESFYKALKETVTHEYFHSVRFKHYPNYDESLLDTLVGEGLAENFKDSICGSSRSLWTKAVSNKKSKEIFSEISDKLGERDSDFYRELFFSDDKYSLWAGYSIGYNLVNDFLSNQKLVDWNLIAKMPSENIAKGSRWY